MNVMEEIFNDISVVKSTVKLAGIT